MRTSKTNFARALLLLGLVFQPFLAACGDGSSTGPGATEFTSEDQDPRRGDDEAADGDANAGAGGASPAAPGAPQGRNAQVEEADIYRMVGNRLFYLNTYRGFVVYDVTDTKKPQALGRLPVYGYPVEMFVEGTTVYALLRDVLTLEQTEGQARFERRDVSQLVTIDVADPANPRLLAATDIIGELREGVSRKVQSTIYVVSYVPQTWWYWYGGSVPADQQKEQAWVYSFDVSAPQAPRLAGQLKLFEGGSVQVSDPKGAFSFSKTFSSVAISATSNALMVVENWDWSSSGGYANGRCGFYESNQSAVVSLVDISDPTGTIRLHARFETEGHLGDQFKQTYVFDEATKTGTYYGIFARQTWSSSGCGGSQIVRNTLESWDVTGTTPTRLARLDFGKEGETVRGSAFDPARKLVYAITARQIDPLYAISLADRTKPQILSEIDRLSGDMTVFRLVGDGKFLLGIGRDGSSTCTGFDDNQTGWWRSNVAVSLIDVQNVAAIRLVQRKCVDVKSDGWASSEVQWNLDQGHKMLGMHSDGNVNVITVPVQYWSKPEDDFGWYEYHTAVGLMTWDLTAYDPTKNELEQTVLKNYGTFVHPHGAVQRSILFNHQATKRRMMMNLSDTHISIADIQDLAAPKLDAEIELAPFHSALYRFGDHLVEEVRSFPNGGYYGWGNQRGKSEFRIKAVGGSLEGKPALATFTVGGVERVLKHGNNLLVFRRVPRVVVGKPETSSPQLVVYDLSTPTAPKRIGVTALPENVMPYYQYWCGDWAWGGYYFGGSENIVAVDTGLMMLNHQWGNNQVEARLVFIDLRNPSAPAVRQQVIDTHRTDGNDWWWTERNLIADGMDPRGFFVTSRERIGQVKRGGGTLNVFRDYAERFSLAGEQWKGAGRVNVPGRLARTFAAANGERLYLTSDYDWRWIEGKDGQAGHSESRLRLALLRASARSGRPVAELLDRTTFEDTYPKSMVLESQRLYLVGGRDAYGWGGGWLEGDGVAVAAQTAQDSSDRLTVLDLSAGKLTRVLDASTNLHNVGIVGLHRGQLVLNLAGDGLLVLDVSNPTRYVGKQFLRTLGWASHVEFAGDDVYVASGNFGVYQMSLGGPPEIALQ